MKRNIFFLIVSLVFLLCSCARWGGDNPLGITGGSKEGYGQNSDLFLPGEIDQELVGGWGYFSDITREIFTFNQDGTFTLDKYMDDQLVNTIAGRWSVSGDILTMYAGSITETYRYEINGNELILYYANDQMILHRVLLKAE